SFMQIAIRSRLKLFYRPAKLSLDPFDAMKKVVFKATPKGVLVDNQTPYYMNYIGLLHQNKPAKNVKMVAPFSQAVFEAKGVRSGDKLKWVLVNDYGADQEGDAIAQ
ncbi:TPA: molecular chaperone, partial [Haemophilus influenzae]